MTRPDSPPRGGPGAEPGTDAAGEPQGDTSSLPGGLDRVFRTALIVVPIGVLGNLIFSLWITDRELLASLGAFPREWLLLAVALGLLPWLTNSLRLYIWTRFLDEPISFRDAWQITLGWDIGSAVSPTAVGGGFFKWGMLVQKGLSPGAAASVTTLPSIEDAVFFALAVPAAIVLTASWDNPAVGLVAEQFTANAPVVLLGALGIALATWLAVRWVLKGALGTRVQRRGLHLFARTRRKLRSSWADAREVFALVARKGKTRFALTLGLTAVQWTARYSVISALVAFLGAPVQPVLFWLLQWVVFTLMQFIPTPGATGGAEAAFFLVYSAFLPERVIGLATAGWRFLTFYLQLTLASVFFFVLTLRERRARRTA